MKNLHDVNDGCSFSSSIDMACTLLSWTSWSSFVMLPERSRTIDLQVSHRQLEQKQIKNQDLDGCLSIFSNITREKNQKQQQSWSMCVWKRRMKTKVKCVYVLFPRREMTRIFVRPRMSWKLTLSLCRSSSSHRHDDDDPLRRIIVSDRKKTGRNRLNCIVLSSFLSWWNRRDNSSCHSCKQPSSFPKGLQRLLLLFLPLLF